MLLSHQSFEAWTGRIDSREDFDAFRWHQWIQRITLNELEMNDVKEDESFKIAFVGFACDLGIVKNKGRMGAAKGPLAIRKALANLPCHFSKKVRLYDVGDIIVSSSKLEEAQLCLAKVIEKIVANGFFPIVLGGGHELAFGHYQGLCKSYDFPSIINLDAHFDMRPYADGRSSGTMFRQIADQCHHTCKPFQYMAVGIQKRGNTMALFKTVKALGGEYILAEAINQRLTRESLAPLEAYIRKSRHIYLTLCTDVIASAFASGVSAPQPLGLSPEDVIAMLKTIIQSGKVVGFDIAEVSPWHDRDNTTAILASTLIFAVVNALAQLNGVEHPYII
jgi:formiminoglutamase